MRKVIEIALIVLLSVFGALLSSCAGAPASEVQALNRSAQPSAALAVKPGNSPQTAPLGEQNGAVSGAGSRGAAPDDQAPAERAAQSAAQGAAQGGPLATPEPNGQTAGRPAGDAPAGAPITATHTLPRSLLLAIGLLKLEATDQAVTADQAAVLLPLWQQAQSLAQSASTPAAAASAAPDPSVQPALFDQIEAALTAGQVTAIDALTATLAADDLAALAETYGIDLPVNPLATPDASLRPTPPAGMSPGGQPPAGGPGGAGGQPPSGGPPSGGPEGGLQGGQPPQGQGMGREIESALYQVIIQLLTSKLNP